MRLTLLLDRLTAALSWLVLPLALLLAAQWPLRDLVGAGSRQANDLAQWIFACYVALALRAATRDRTHLATDVLAARYRPRIAALLARVGHARAAALRGFRARERRADGMARARPLRPPTTHRPSV